MIQEKLEALRLQLNYVCYDKEMLQKLDKVWQSFYELETEVKKLPIHGVMQAASASVSEAAVASEGEGEANTCADAGCPQCKNTDVYDIDDHWTKCNNCGFTFVG